VRAAALTLGLDIVLVYDSGKAVPEPQREGRYDDGFAATSESREYQSCRHRQ
jgi:hypothetical protein